MSITEVEKALIRCLKSFNLSKDQIMGVLMLLKTNDQIKQLAIYLKANPQASSEEVMNKAVEIHYENKMQQAKQDVEFSNENNTRE